MFTRNPFRSLSLSLILAAGLALAGCSDESPAPAPAPAPAPPTAPPAPDPVGVPGGLSVIATGSDFLEFSWEAVVGATGYEIQLTLKEDDWTSVATATVTTTTRRFPVAAATTGWARVRAHEGDRQSAWSETASGTSTAAPVPPLVLGAPEPTVSSTGPDHIEWSWDPVADALAYQVRVAATREGLDAATLQITAETTHRVTTEPGMEMFLRVRAAAGTPESPVIGDWSDAVAGMSEAAATPFVVSMAPPGADGDRGCSGQVFCPDDGTDPKTAMASVNTKMVVSLSDPARITPLFVEDALGIPVEAGQGMTPFAYLDWNALQAEVVRNGVTFEFRRMTAGAGQEPMPTGDARYITCGPFRCSEAAAETPEAPEMTTEDSAVCREFEVDFKLVKGIEDNRYVYREQAGRDVHRRAVGMDSGWEYTLSHPAELTHEFTDIQADSPSGTMTVKGAPLKVTSDFVALCMGVSTGDPICAEFRQLLLPTETMNRFGAVVNQDGAFDSMSEPYPILNGWSGRPIDCWPPGASGWNEALWLISYERIGRSLGQDRPDPALQLPKSCFRLITGGWPGVVPQNTAREVRFRNYVPGYRLHVDPLVGVSWTGSEVAWGDDDPFADLRCERVTFQVSDQYDYCDDFRAEAEAYWGNGIGAGGQFQVEYRLSGTDNTDGKVHHIVVRNKAPISAGDYFTGQEYRPRGSRMGHMWLVRDDPGTPTNTAIDGTKRDKDVYRMGSVDWNDDNTNARERWTGGAPDPNGVVDWWPVMSVALEDADGDPLYGDFGKIDMANAAGTRGSDGDPENFDGNADADFCTDADGPGCDSVQDFDLSATFTYLRDTDICTWTTELPLTCTWDADGDGHRRGDTAFDTDVADDWHENGKNLFVRCEAR